MTAPLKGVFAAVLTPLDADLAPAPDVLALHGRWLLANGCDGLSVLGTTGEANSFSVEERVQILEGLAEADIPGEALMPGTGCCAIPDTVRLTAKAVQLGVVGVLMLPPFYYKPVTDDGLFAYYAEVIDRIGDARLKVYLYHFPQMSGVPLGPRLIERLRDRYPDTVVGMEDSSGDFETMRRIARSFPGFSVFSGSDEFLWPLLNAGGAGCITAVCNVASVIAAEVYAAWTRGDADVTEHAQADLTAVRKTIAAYPLTAALKEIMARHTGKDDWRRVRPPLAALTPADALRLLAELDRLGFRPPPPP